MRGSSCSSRSADDSSPSPGYFTPGTHNSLVTELEPQLRSAIDGLAESIPEWHTLSVEQARELEADLFTPDEPPPVDQVWEITIDGPGGELPLRAYLHNADAPAPVCLFFHGGGWVMGRLDSADDLAREIARRSGCLVVSVDYRLAPEHPFPAAVEDAKAALSWVESNAASIHGDPERLAVAGSSAGGTLAAGLARWSREDATPSVEHTLLLYPIIDPEADTTVPDAPLLSRADVNWFWDLYLPDEADRQNPAAAPAGWTELTGLPPTTVVTAGFDPLGVEGSDFADRLDRAGVPVDHLHYPHLSHGFLSLADRVNAAEEAMSAANDRVGAAFRE